ncbi:MULTISPECIES: helix-turn-helix transcriptional regulator [unclassified Streptomyces]|uniref:helix-turn-helix domain-containing protein n=1 Tax=unclassified Streptomyces TaxID=2593676 RepID=UPI000DBA3E73|nr:MULTISPECIES: helix-turn-helix transcriptional regulator [unclassified Streptomyces]MYT72079.1 helix-turn-helix domain-containing protein [Streptomyces sp. SID8367]
MEERVSGDGFAQLLRELKDRSGLSYGVLAKRLHMSTSTLHRYCNGTAVPTDYAPVERLARLCKAAPEELVELHRRWILADAARGRKADPAPAPEPVPEPDEEAVAHPGPVTASRRRTAVIAGIAVAAVTGAVVLAVNLGGGGGGDADRRQAAEATAAGRTGADRDPSASATPSPSASPSKKTKPSASATTSAPSSTAGSGGDAKGPDSGGAAPLNVNTRPYVYDSPCSQHFLVDSEPAQVGPPAGEQDATRWAAAYGAVSSGEQEVALTVQGSGARTVVLEALSVRVVSKSAPLAWNDYAMGSGCGGGVDTKSFDVDLDDGSPAVTVKGGQRDFPYKVSESDPEVFYVVAHTKAHDVRWELTLEYSSGGRHGTVRVDNGGTPFRTSGNAGRPGYDYPLGGGEWIARQEQQ